MGFIGTSERMRVFTGDEIGFGLTVMRIAVGVTVILSCCALASTFTAPSSAFITVGRLAITGERGC